MRRLTIMLSPSFAADAGGGDAGFATGFLAGSAGVLPALALFLALLAAVAAALAVDSFLAALAERGLGGAAADSPSPVAA